MCVANAQLDVCSVGSIYMYRPVRLYVTCDGRWMAGWLLCRYFFKTASDEFCVGGVVLQEVVDDQQLLPTWRQGTVVCKLELMP